VRLFGQPVVMVTHDPPAASSAVRVVVLGAGRVVDELSAPTAEAVLVRLKRLVLTATGEGSAEAGAR
jgi:putative ABC transport system ATP-binding protein